MMLADAETYGTRLTRRDFVMKMVSDVKFKDIKKALGKKYTNSDFKDPFQKQRH